MDCSDFDGGCVMMTHGLLWEPQMTCQSSQTGSVSVQTDLALPIHYSECLAKPGSAPLLITAGRHIRLTPSSVDTHALVHTQRIRAFHCVHTHRAVAFIILFVQPLFVTITTYTMIAKNYQKKIVFLGCIPQQSHHLLHSKKYHSRQPIQSKKYASM